MTTHVADLQIVAVSRLLSELGLSQTLISPLAAHADAVEHDADRLGLVSLGDIGSVLSRHTADSLLFALARAPEPGERWVDVGSGAGFPGLVLAMCYPDAIFTLIEPQQRRAGFLDLQVTRLGLVNARVLGVRAADVDETFDVATARALAEPLLAFEAMRALVPAGPCLIAVGESATALAGVDDLDVSRAGVDSPGRIFMMTQAAEGA
ncbi:MAG TPA: RsmG family class I SAM-dependent methyltransferase [Actinomycetota bacterium]|nr:RsmG family class I SAM-dependent methyltransferase [Actinomycetota bacterium]